MTLLGQSRRRDWLYLTMPARRASQIRNMIRIRAFDILEALNADEKVRHLVEMTAIM